MIITNRNFPQIFIFVMNWGGGGASNIHTKKRASLRHQTSGTILRCKYINCEHSISEHAITLTK